MERVKEPIGKAKNLMEVRLGIENCSRRKQIFRKVNFGWSFL